MNPSVFNTLSTTWCYPPTTRSLYCIIYLFCQAMAEGAVIATPGQYDLDIRKIQNKEVRDPQVNSLKANATAFAQLILSKRMFSTTS
jgi:hypothetical protein